MELILLESREYLERFLFCVNFYFLGIFEFLGSGRWGGLFRIFLNRDFFVIFWVMEFGFIYVFNWVGCSWVGFR